MLLYDKQEIIKDSIKMMLYLQQLNLQTPIQTNTLEFICMLK